MVRALVIIMIATFVLALGCFGGVVGMAGPAIAKDGWVWPKAWKEAGYFVKVSEGHDDDPDSTRELAWTAGSSLQIDMPAEVVYTQGPETRIEISGPTSIIEQVAIDGDRLHFTDEGHLPRRETITVTITAPAVKRFVVNGSPTLTITGYDQPELAVLINGSGDVSAGGRADKVSIEVSGSGKADLSAFQTKDANVSIAGSGEATLAPTGAAKVAIAGSGDVNLLTRPASLEKDIGGSGDVHVEE